MMWDILATFHILFFIAVPISLGSILIKPLSKYSIEHDTTSSSLLYVSGLAYQLLFTFFLKVIGLPWWLASYLPLLLLLLDLHSLKLINRVFKPEATFAYLLWFTVISSIGVSLFSVLDGIQTPWSNNYGDLTFHIGMITSFTFGENFPPEYQIFAGESLSYPFFINLWSAMLWWPDTDWSTLSFIFCLQFIVCWTLVYQLVSGSRFLLLPWVILFGGGAYSLLMQESSPHIGAGYPWAVFLTTIWIPQRTFSIGLACMLAILWIFFRGLSFSNQPFFEIAKKEQQLRLLYIGLLLGVLFLLHGHSALAVGLFIGINFISGAIREIFTEKEQSKQKTKDLLVSALYGLIPFFLVFALLSPWLLGKSSLIETMYGWTNSNSGAVGIERVKESFMMWKKNAWQLVFLVAPLMFFKKFRTEVFLCIFLFFLFNYVKIAEWEWDQIKLFVALYCILVALWSYLDSKNSVLVHFMLLPLIVPALVECYVLFNKGSMFTVYTKEKIRIAEDLKKLTGAKSIISAPPEHHSAATLSGRKLFTGYPGTLSSHKLDYAERAGINKQIQSVAKCNEVASVKLKKYCPTHLLWDSHAPGYWNGENPNTRNFEKLNQNIFKLKNSEQKTDN